MITTPILPGTSQNAIAQAAALLAAGDSVAFATETVYGLGADARNPAALAKIYAAKSRPQGNPLIVHVQDAAAAQQAAAAWPPIAEKLAQHFWPGPLTLILPRGSLISPAVSAGRDTVAIRVPNHPVAQALLKAFDGPIAAPSANRSGFTSPTTAQHVLAELDGRIPLILDGGPCQIGLESTVLDLTTTPPTILRPGAITQAMLENIIGPVQTRHAVIAESDSAPSPGQHAQHYAPRTPAFHFAPSQFPQAAAYASTHAPAALLTWNNQIALPAPHHTILLSDNEAAYARNFYIALREADALESAVILVLTPPNGENLWAAIADRLNRASKPLPSR